MDLRDIAICALFQPGLSKLIPASRSRSRDWANYVLNLERGKATYRRPWLHTAFGMGIPKIWRMRNIRHIGKMAKPGGLQALEPAISNHGESGSGEVHLVISGQLPFTIHPP